MSTAFDAVMADLEAEFQATLAEHQAALRTARRAWDNGDAGALAEIHRRAHRIAGVAGLFHANAIGDAAEAVERAILADLAPQPLTVVLDRLMDFLPPLEA